MVQKHLIVDRSKNRGQIRHFNLKLFNSLAQWWQKLQTPENSAAGYIKGEQGWVRRERKKRDIPSPVECLKNGFYQITLFKYTNFQKNLFVPAEIIFIVND